MPDIESLMLELHEVTLAKKEGSKHDKIRMEYRGQKEPPENFEEFSWLIGDYYNYHYTSCNSLDGSLPAHEAIGRAKEILTQEYRRHGGDIGSAYQDAHDGTNGGVRFILDTLADRLKAESIERYIRDAFDSNVAPNSWEQKVEIIKQFIQRNKDVLDPEIHLKTPESYAHEYEQLIRSFVNGLQSTSSMFRRL
jgi:hypothetical protein